MRHLVVAGVVRVFAYIEFRRAGAAAAEESRTRHRCVNTHKTAETSGARVCVLNILTVSCFCVCPE